MLSQRPVDAVSQLQALKSHADWVGLRYVREQTTHRVIRNDSPDMNRTSVDEGVMVEVLVDGHFGHAGTSDTSAVGVRRAFDRAMATTRSAAAQKVFPFTTKQRPVARGAFESPRQQRLSDTPLSEITDSLLAASRAMKISELIVNRLAAAMIVQTEIDFFSSDGSDTRQVFDMIDLTILATAQEGPEAQTRTYSRSGQIGGELFDRALFGREGERVAREAIEALRAENCPSETMDLLLMPDQMMLQIHESIGHPLELDRILGDERNYAGWSFVRPEDFGRLQYGSALMNVTFDPSTRGSLASYAFDDGGTPATKEFLIRNGVLERGLGSLESQERSGIKGVANFRSANWNRAPIDRMANVNLEGGSTSLSEMIAGVERGMLMTSNRSWSIDDYRNKFQFSCERGQLIENGKLTRVVRNPNYRGTTTAFWNRLSAVGLPEEVVTFGTPYCGKGEPSQVIRVGHSAPPCLFSGIEVFGGQS
jgi:predicted Zn-dependent protease